MKQILLLTALALPLAAPAMADNHTMGHAHHGASKDACPHAAPADQTAKKSASTVELMKANAVMHKDMDITYTHDADIDFLRGMIAHHQGAVEMAEVQLKYGKDAQIKRLSQDIIRAQNLEIAWMKRWLAQLEKRPLTYSNTPTGSGAWSDTKWTGDDGIWLNER